MPDPDPVHDAQASPAPHDPREVEIADLGAVREVTEGAGGPVPELYEMQPV